MTFICMNFKSKNRLMEILKRVTTLIMVVQLMQLDKGKRNKIKKEVLKNKMLISLINRLDHNQ